MHDEERLKEKLRVIEALFAGATTEGEREAADRARQRTWPDWWSGGANRSDRASG